MFEHTRGPGRPKRPLLLATETPGHLLIWLEYVDFFAKQVFLGGISHFLHRADRP